MPKAARAFRAAALCGTCPLLAVCAAEAHTDKPIGVIRAGVGVVTARPTAWQLSIWKAVAAGRSLPAAIAEHTPASLWDIEKVHTWYNSEAGIQVLEALPTAALVWLEDHALLGPLTDVLDHRLGRTKGWEV